MSARPTKRAPRAFEEFMGPTRAERFLAGMNSHESDEWLTPPEVLECVYAFDEVALDPCSHRDSLVVAREKYDIRRRQDGLALPWRGLTWCNSPYGDALPLWLCKAYYSWLHRKVESILLVPASTSIGWWHDYAVRAASVAFWRGRISFRLPRGAKKNSNSPFFSSALLYFGKRVRRFREAFEPAAWVVRS